MNILRSLLILALLVLLCFGEELKLKECEPPCNDDNDCTKDYCEPTLGVCLYIPLSPPPPGCCGDDRHCEVDRCHSAKCISHQCTLYWDESACGVEDSVDEGSDDDGEINPPPPVNDVCMGGSTHDDYAPSFIEMNKMSTCCWKNTMTCCAIDGRVVKTVGKPSQFASFFRTFKNQGYPEACALAWADLQCVACGPDTKHYVTDNGSENERARYTTKICMSTCRQIYTSCAVGEGFYTFEEFCKTNTVDSPLYPFVVVEEEENCYKGNTIEETRSAVGTCLPSWSSV